MLCELNPRPRSIVNHESSVVSGRLNDGKCPSAKVADVPLDSLCVTDRAQRAGRGWWTLVAMSADPGLQIHSKKLFPESNWLASNSCRYIHESHEDASAFEASEQGRKQGRLQKKRRGFCVMLDLVVNFWLHLRESPVPNSQPMD